MTARTPSARLLSASLLCATGLTASGCSPHGVNTQPQAPVDLPQTFGQEGAAAPLPDRWWEDFRDASLNALVERALRDNLQLKGAWARLAQAEAMIASARAGRWPQVGGSIDAQRRESFFGGPLGKVTQETYGISMPVSYELDLWNKFGSGVDAAAAMARASRDDVEGTAMTLSAEVAEAWFDVLNTRAAQDLLERQREANETQQKLVQLRFDQGLAAAVDVYQQRQQVLSTRAQLETLAGQRALAEGRLAVLLGVTPAALQLDGDAQQLPPAPALPGAGVPADLLERRPDLRAARNRLVAADHQVAQAIAQRLPSLSIGAQLGYSASSPEQLLDNLLKSISGSIQMPILDGGRGAAEVRRTKATVDEGLALYGQTLLQAIVEVENSLAVDRQQVATLAVLEAQRETAEATLREARQRYLAGLSDYLPVLNALIASQSIERNLLDAQRQRLSTRIQLCRALGGTWTAALGRPEPDEDPS